MRDPPEYLKPGDVIESEIELLGKIRNRVISYDEAMLEYKKSLHAHEPVVSRGFNSKCNLKKIFNKPTPILDLNPTDST